MKISAKIICFIIFIAAFLTGCNKTEVMEEGNLGSEKIVSKQENTVKGKTDSQKNTSEKSLSGDINIEEQIDELISTLSLEEKVGQLFIVLPEAIIDVNCVTAAGEMTKDAMNAFPVGGFMYLEGNLVSPEQVREMLSGIQQYSLDRNGIPAFTCVDEEGGTVARIANKDNFSVPQIGNMSALGAEGDVEKVEAAGKTVGNYLSDLGFNVDFAPVADVLSNPQNEVVRERSFGDDPSRVSDMAYAFFQGLKECDLYGVYKHFPGHGATAGDTHQGYSYTSKTLEELQNCDFVPFQNAIDKGLDFIMVGHISLPTITGDEIPASMSEGIIQDILRKQLRYEGIVITDALNMGAIAQNYSSAQAAVGALLAGADILLMPQNFQEAYYAIIKAVDEQIVSTERIDESLRRILKVKLELKNKVFP